MKQIYSILISNLIFIISYGQSSDEKVSHYLFPEFTKGTILMKSGAKNEASLNYNSLTEEMVFERDNKKLAITNAEMVFIDTFFIEGRKFFVLDGKFVELLNQSKWSLYSEYKCKMEKQGDASGYGGTSQTSSVESYSSLAVGTFLLELELPDGYKVKPYNHYWLRRNGELDKFMNMKQLKKLYKEKSELYKSYVKKNAVKYNNREKIIQLIEYMESN